MKGGVFCQQPACTVSGKKHMTVECPLCNEKVFCSQECKINKRGLYWHIEHDCEKKRAYTPRSVLDKILKAIQDSEHAKKDLFERFKKGQTENGAGMMYLVVQDMDTACTMLNSSITDIGILMSSLAFYTPLKKLNHSLEKCGRTLLDEEEGKEDKGDFFLLSIRSERQGSVIHTIYV